MSLSTGLPDNLATTRGAVLQWILLRTTR
ncbi:hypothetical protein MIPYR_30222 [uncultured Microbacterium sp.]|uniref:Uncharacterized protein n=1 Tax=uncultured Microbacterium sp. TaxID=191216 RepID=A0A1Y5P247_9MICO|nr:hypothetical protein MIPYR_30222 [uncultured Microbacterium sp.]